MSVRPLDLQINVNSTLSLAQKEGLKTSQFETRQFLMADKQAQDQQKSDGRVNFIEESEKSRKVHDHKVSLDNNGQNEAETSEKEEKSYFKRRQPPKKKPEKKKHHPTSNINFLA